MSTTRAQGVLGDELANLGIGLLTGAAALALLLRAAGAVAAWATGIPQPAGGPEAGLAVLLVPGDPSAALDAPGLHPVAFWITTTVLCGAAVTVAVWLWRMLHDTGRAANTDPHRIPGIATRTDVKRAASQTALMKRVAHLRPSLSDAGPTDAGYLLGRSRGTNVWASVED